MDQKKSGLFIRDLRKEKGMSQKQFAAVLNVSESAVCKWEKGVNLPDTLNLQALSDIFQVTVNELLDGERLQMPNLNQCQEAEVTPESKPTQEPEPTPELESDSEEHLETDPAPEPKPVPDSIPATDLADADNPPKTMALHRKRRVALCNLCISVLTVHTDSNRTTGLLQNSKKTLLLRPCKVLPKNMPANSMRKEKQNT